jgi:phosphoribosylformylglycinamidine cyclo-ligase
MDYKSAGVNVDAGYEVVKRIKNKTKATFDKNVLSNIGAFAGSYDISNLDIKDPVLISSTDGVGTKLKLAFALNKHDTVGIDLVAMCVNDIVCVGAKPLFFLDYIAQAHLIPKKVEQIVKGIANACKEVNCSLIGGETAEMPNMYKKGEYDLAGFCTGVVSKKKIPNIKNVLENDILIGLSSSGVHSNGFSLIRKVYKNTLYKNKKLMKTLITPTKLYVKPILELFENNINIKGIANITGGGFYENIERVLPNSLSASIKKSNFDIPTIFTDIAKKGNINTKNMFNTFNMGIGMVIIIDKKDKTKALKMTKNYGGVEIGYIKKKKTVSVELLP